MAVKPPPGVNTAPPSKPVDPPLPPFHGAKGSLHTPKGSEASQATTPAAPHAGDSKSSTPVSSNSVAAPPAAAAAAAAAVPGGAASADDATVEVEGSLGDEQLAVRIVHMELTEEQLDDSTVADILHTVESGIGPPSYIMVGNKVLDDPNMTLRAAGLGTQAEFQVFLPESALLPEARDDGE